MSKLKAQKLYFYHFLSSMLMGSIISYGYRVTTKRRIGKCYSKVDLKIYCNFFPYTPSYIARGGEKQ